MKKSQKQVVRKNGGVSIRLVGVVTLAIAIVLAFVAFASAGYIADAEEAVAVDQARYIECSEAIDNMQRGSDYLTTQARMFVLTGEREYMDAYIYEYAVDNQRARAVDVLKVNLSEDLDSVKELERALFSSNLLARKELAAMRFAADYYGIDELPQEIASADLSVVRAEPTGDARLDVAKDLVIGKSYDNDKKAITTQVKASSDALMTQLTNSLEENKANIQSLLFTLRISVALLLCVILVFVLALFMYVLKPLSHYVERLIDGKPLKPDGAYELHYLADAYNSIYEDNNKRIEQLREYAERDPLTGISNRVGYSSFLATHTRNIALLLIDVDNFKEFNRVYGHDTGDAVLIKIAEALGTAFRSTDFPCRIEADTFAVVMTNMSTESRNAILNKMDIVNEILADDVEDLPAVTLSVGAAFSAEGMDDKAIYDAARNALQQAKQEKSGGVYFYGETLSAE